MVKPVQARKKEGCTKGEKSCCMKGKEAKATDTKATEKK